MKARARPRAEPTAPLTPIDLLGAPELAALDLLGHAVHVAGLALLAQYPHLLGDEYGRVRHGADPVAEVAAQLVRRMRDLDDVLRRYRHALGEANSPARDDDIPF